MVLDVFSSCFCLILCFFVLVVVLVFVSSKSEFDFILRSFFLLGFCLAGIRPTMGFLAGYEFSGNLGFGVLRVLRVFVVFDPFRLCFGVGLCLWVGLTHF